jgi:hypothetical protein
MFLTESSFQALSHDWCPGEDSRLRRAKHLICNAPAPRSFLVYRAVPGSTRGQLVS